MLGIVPQALLAHEVPAQEGRSGEAALRKGSGKMLKTDSIFDTAWNQKS